MQSQGEVCTVLEGDVEFVSLLFFLVPTKAANLLLFLIAFQHCWDCGTAEQGPVHSSSQASLNSTAHSSWGQSREPGLLKSQQSWGETKGFFPLRKFRENSFVYFALKI